MFSVSILEAKTIIRSIEKNYGTDLSGLAMASFRLRISELLQTYKVKDTNSLVGNLIEDRNYYERFIRDISIGSPDMFRDPDLWINFRDELLPSILKSWRYPEIVIPESNTGNELFTLLVILKEMGLDYRVDLTITCLNQKIQDQIMKAELPYIKYKNSKDNYQVFNPGSSFEDFTVSRAGSIYLKKELLQRVKCRLQDPKEPVCSEKTALVLYRNRMIYQNAERQYKMLKHLLNDMNAGTYFITGIQELIDGFRLKHLYETISPDLKIYQKKDGR